MEKPIQHEEPRTGIKLWNRWVTGPLSCADFSSSQHWTALGFDDGVVQLIDDHGHEVWSTSLNVPLTHVRVADSSRRVITLDEHSRLVFLDLKGKVLKEKNFDQYWTSFELKSNCLVVWGWRSPPRRITFQGKEVRQLAIPKPWRIVRAIPNEDLYFVIHNQISLGVYTGSGSEVWSANHPVPIDLSRDHPSEVVTSDKGEMVAVSCFDKGVYIYDVKKRTLRHLDLDAMASRVAVSGNGKWSLIADAMGTLYLVDKEATIVWQETLPSKVHFCKLDQKGERALVLEENGNLICFKFANSSQQRHEFLEVGGHQTIRKPREIWKQEMPAFPGNWGGVLKLSEDGRFILYGETKEFSVFDANGDRVWHKPLMVRREDGWISRDGNKILLSNPEEIFLATLDDGFERHLTFYGDGVSEIGLDASGAQFLVLHKSGALSLFNDRGRQLWRGSLNQRVSKIRLNIEQGIAVFQGKGKSIYILDLKTHKVSRIKLEASVSRLRISRSSIFAGDVFGNCYGMDYRGSVRWTHGLRKTVERIIPLDQGVGFLSTEGHLVIFQDDGVLLGEGKLRHQQSIVAYVGDEIIEVTPEGQSVGCYRFLQQERLWQQAFPGGVNALAVGQYGNRVAVLLNQSLHFLRLLDVSETTSGRGAFLEL